MSSPAFFGFTGDGELVLVTAEGITAAEPITPERQAAIDALPDATITVEGFRLLGEEWPE